MRLTVAMCSARFRRLSPPRLSRSQTGHPEPHSSGWSADLARRGRRHADGRGGAADPVHPTPTPAVVWIYTAVLVLIAVGGQRRGRAGRRVRDLHARHPRLGRLRRLPRSGLSPLVWCAPRRQEACEPAAFGRGEPAVFGRGEEDATGAFTDVPLATMVWERSHSSCGDPVLDRPGALVGARHFYSRAVRWASRRSADLTSARRCRSAARRAASPRRRSPT